MFDLLHLKNKFNSKELHESVALSSDHYSEMREFVDILIAFPDVYMRSYPSDMEPSGCSRSNTRKKAGREEEK